MLNKGTETWGTRPASWNYREEGKNLMATDDLAEGLGAVQRETGIAVLAERLAGLLLRLQGRR